MKGIFDACFTPRCIPEKKNFILDKTANTKLSLEVECYISTAQTIILKV